MGFEIILVTHVCKMTTFVYGSIWDPLPGNIEQGRLEKRTVKKREQFIDCGPKFVLNHSNFYAASCHTV